jgi:UDP-N-acetylglucosamine--N-acetylmuramyl-(pentapeptide) pyrophosphoryl-undecaprenol N-acetylglucosamine transferase
MTKTVLLAAGGTGGHLFPAEALAQELKARGWDVHLATDRRAERFAGAFGSDHVHTIDSATIGSRNPLAVAKSFLALWRGFRQASILINRLKPAAVVGFGGYPTLPPLYAASRRGVPSAIHEQNAVMGRANRALAGRVTRIAGGFLEAKGPHAARIVQTGNPVRQAVIDASASPYVSPGTEGDIRLLVFGGSQGAQFFGEAIPQALARLDEGLRRRLRVTLQARADDEAGAKAALAEAGISAEVAPFFPDLARRMGEAHLVVSRSGASTVSEIAVIGRPAILVPYPHALDHDQAANAAALAAAGGAEVHPQSSLSPDRLAELIGDMLKDPARLATMAAAARATAKPDAARLLADLVEDIAGARGAKIQA